MKRLIAATAIALLAGTAAATDKFWGDPNLDLHGDGPLVDHEVMAGDASEMGGHSERYTVQQEPKGHGRSEGRDAGHASIFTEDDPDGFYHGLGS